ncbi:uncharacterized protein LOC144658177 [Oculina patagonica]
MSSEELTEPGTSAESSDEEGLVQKFGNVSISGSSTEEESSKANQQEDLERTPEQKNVTTKRESGPVRRGLAYPDVSSEEKIGSAEKDDGTWLLEHPWDKGKDAHPDRINKSKVYTVKEEWMTGDKIDLKKIYARLPEFIRQMKGKTCNQELERLLHVDEQNVTIENGCVCIKNLKLEAINCTPHIQEIVHKKTNVPPNDQGSNRPDGDKSFKAFSLAETQQNNQPSEENYWRLDCEYMLTMYLPDNSSQWFDIHDQVEKRIRAINSEKSDKRWIFIPSFRRAQIALLDWPEDEFVTPDSTLRILVVRPSEFEEYVNYCGHMFPVISLPQDEIGAGYPRLWIQKIALRLKLDFIWMIDDSVECFYEYHPKMAPPERDDGTKNYTDYRRRRFGLVFERIEKFVKETKDENLPITAMSEKLVKETKDKNPPIAAMSPKRFMGGTKLEEPFVCKPPRIAVFLNIAALKSKEVYYRPELQALEDMIFGYECEKNGLKVFIDNRVHLQDKKWTDTGARSPSVQQKQA